MMASHCYNRPYTVARNRLHDINDTGLQLIRSSLLAEYLCTAFHTMLGISTTAVAVITLLFTQHAYSMSPYLYLGYDYIHTVAQYIHH